MTFNVRGARAAAAVFALLGIGAIALVAQAPQARDGAGRRRGFEVWLADQSDTRPRYGGQLLIYEGSDLMGQNAERAQPIERLDLGAGAADLCRAATGRNPVRPHMIAFNREHTHAVLSFVASGHVVICPIIDASSRLAFVTLRGGGLFVVNAAETPMAIAAEYDAATVKGNGCGGIQIGTDMFMNSGGSPVNVSSGNPHHPALYGFDVYRFPTSGFRSAAPLPVNSPAPTLILSKSGMSDSHGTVATQNDKYLWVMDRHANVAEIVDVDSGKWIETVNLAGRASSDPAPDLADRSPSGNRLFVALRGPVPLSGDPHNATGSTPGLGIIQVTRGGRDGKLMAVVPLINALQQPNQQPDAHGLRVRERK